MSVAPKRNHRPLAPFDHTSVSIRINCNGRLIKENLKKKTRKHYI